MLADEKLGSGRSRRLRHGLPRDSIRHELYLMMPAVECD